MLITDVEMPGIDGFELTRHIRGNPHTAMLPVIMITAADDRHREHADAAGVSVLLGKPYSEDALIAKLYEIEREARELQPEARRLWRQHHAKPVAEACLAERAALRPIPFKVFRA